MSETLDPRVRKNIVFTLKLAGAMVGAALLLALARQQGLVGRELVVRAYGITVGLGLAVHFNGWPKAVHGPPPHSIHDATVTQAVVRVGSWAMTLAFLAWATLWAFAPQRLAVIGSVAALCASAAVMLGCTVWKYVACRTPSSDPAGRP